MLMLFHLINILIIRYLRNKRLLEEENFVGNSETMINTAIETTEIDHEDLENNISFDPPLYRQRYGRVYEILIDERWRTKVSKLCDFGCAELGLFIFAKRANKITQMLFVDIDENLLNEKSFKVKPLLVDYVQRRNEPLEISLLAGSIADPDYRISNVDVISAVEVIEHLYPDTLDEFPYNIFNFVEPKIVVVTTPNADFNVLFPDKLTKFRHYDHKFEWTREQFEDWADNITERYPDYIVKFEGLGEGPEGSLHLGHCTQLALFIRKDLLDNNYVLRKYSLPCTCYDKSQCPTCKCTCPCCIPIKSYGTCTFHTHSKIINLNSSDDQNPNTFYNLVESIEYPYEPNTRSEEEKLIQEFRYRINTFNHHNSRFFVRERDRVEIPISDILYGNKFAAITEKELCDLLEKHEYQIERCHVQETDEFEKCIIVTPLMDDFTSSSDQSELDDTISGYFQPVNESVSDWDDDHMDQKNEKVEDSTKGEHKKSIMQALLKNAHLRKDMQELRKDLGSKIKQYQTKLEKVKKDILDIETKADNFATKNDKIFNDIWALNREEAMRLMEDLFLIDKMLHQQQLEPVLTSSRPNESENSKITLDKNAPAQKRPIFGTKPPSTPETNNNLSPEQEETDLFEETASTPSLSSQDNKVHLKRASNIEKTGYMPPPPPLPIDVNKMKLEINRINELDRIHNMPMGRNFFGPFLRSQTEKLRKTYLRDRDNMPGPSNIPFKRRKKMRIAGMASDSEDDVNPLNEMKSVTNCIVENTLNKLNVDEVKPNKDDVIEFNVVPAEEPAVEIKKETIEADVNMEIDNADSMKSGSLSSPIDVPYESLSDPFNDTCRISISIDESSIDPDPNFSSSEPSGNESVPFLSNFSSGGLLSDLDAFSSVQFESETNRFFEECVDLDGELNTIAQASREAIIDANSVQDLLDDFENATSVDELNGFDIVNLGNVILVGIHSIESDNFEHEQNNNFPSWLLQILGTTVPLTELPEDALEEPHYYCQGDGLGVHPSVITVNINDELSSESSNDPNTTDFAEIDPGVSSQDMSSLPEDPVDVSDVRESLNEMRTRRLSNPIINFDANSSEMEIQTSKSC